MNDTPDPRPTEPVVAGAASPDTDEGSRDRRLRSELDAATKEVDTGSADLALAEVREIAHRRRRRRSTIFGVAAAGVLVVGGVVMAGVVNDDAGEDRIVSAPATEPPADTAAADPSADGSTSADAPVEEVTDPVATTAPTESTAPGESSGSVTVSSTSFESGSFVQRFDWKDGFIAIGQSSTSQPLPAELPEEISSQFPIEVTEFFEEAGGLPPTIAEAISMLSEAGLLDVVSEIVANNQEVSDAIYSQPMPEPIVTVQVSDDGVSWTDVEVQVPGSSYDRRITSSGDRLVIASPVVDPASSVDSGMGASPVGVIAVDVFSTTDLETWSEQRVDLPERVPSPYVQRNAYVSQLAANDTGWVLGVDTYEEIDVEALLPDEVESDVLSNEYGYGTSYDDVGVRIELYDGSGSEVTSYTWAELGYDAVPPGLEPGGSDRGGPFENGQQMWSSAWDGVPAVASVGPGYGTVVGFDGGFVRSGMSIQFSSDGVTWSDIEAPGGPDSWTTALVASGDSVGAVVAAPDGAALLHQLDVASLTWSAVDGIELGQPFSPWNDAARGAILYTVEPNMYSAPMDESLGVDLITELNIVNDGYLLAVTFEGSTESYELVDSSTDAVVVAESAESRDDGIAPFEFLSDIDGVITVVSPETGEVITEFTPEQREAAHQVRPGDVVTLDVPSTELPVTTGVVTEMPADSDDVPAGDAEFTEEFPPGQPAMRVLATDGDVWADFAIDVPPPTETEYGPLYVNDVVANDGVVVVSLSDGSALRLEI